MQISCCDDAVMHINNQPKEFSHCGLSISISPNSLPDGIHKCVLRISFKLSTDVVAPPDCELISAIYHLKCEPEVKFKKALTFKIQHCASLDGDSPQVLVFAKASGQTPKFELLDGPVRSCYGSIQLALFGRSKSEEIPKYYCAFLFCKKVNKKSIIQVDIKCVFCCDLILHLKVSIALYSFYL